MCVVSNIGDGWRDQFPERHPWAPENPGIWPYPPSPKVPQPDPFEAEKKSHPTQEEFDALKKEMKELKKLLKAAKRFDEKIGQKDCELDEKIAFIKKIAEFVGVDMKDVFGK